MSIMFKYDVAFFEVFEEEKKVFKKYLPNKVRAFFAPLTIQETKISGPPARLISIRTQSLIPTSWSQHIDGILTRSQGHDHLTKFIQQSRRKVVCGYLGDYCSRAVAEQAIMFYFMLLRKAKQQMSNFDVFKRDNIAGQEVLNKRALVVGVGQIGQQLVLLCRALGMVVRGVDIVQRRDDLEYVSLKAGLQWADVIFCTLPLTQRTQGLLNYKSLRPVKRAPFLINISRGEITPISDIKNLIYTNILSGVALDVFENEPQLAQDLRNKRFLKAWEKDLLALKEEPNVIFTPHNAFNTREALERKAYLSVQSVLDFLKKGKFSNNVLLEE